MKKIFPIAALFALAIGDFGALALTVPASAEAAACVRGARGAACAGPRGAAAVRRPPVRRGAVVVR